VQLDGGDGAAAGGGVDAQDGRVRRARQLERRRAAERRQLDGIRATLGEADCTRII
jgi:hypothetical protein